jgi:hypothetical protein
MQNPNNPFASVMGLGPLKTEHPANKTSARFNLGCGIVSLIAVPILLVLSAYLFFDVYSRFGPARIDDKTFDIFWPLGAAALALALGAWLIFDYWRNRGLAAALYEQGLAYHDRNGLKQVRWDQVDAVWQAITKHYRNGVYTGTTHLYTIQAQGGDRIVLDDKLTKVEELGSAIQQNVASALFPRYVNAITQGQRVTFGPLAIDREGIYSGNKSLTWNEIKAIKLDKGNISIKKEGGWFNWASASVPQIPNFYIFYELIGRLSKWE